MYHWAEKKWVVPVDGEIMATIALSQPQYIKICHFMTIGDGRGRTWRKNK